MASPVRADNVGSLLPPPQIRQAHAAYRERRIDLARLRQIENRAILEVIELQRATSVDVVTDGEYRRDIFAGSLNEGSAPISVKRTC